MVQVHRTSSNHFEPHYCRDIKVCKVLTHVFGVVRLHWTFSKYTLMWQRKCAACLCPSLRCIEPLRTCSNHIVAEIARFFSMSLVWLDFTEHSLSTPSRGKQSVQRAYAPVRGSSSASQFLKPSWTTYIAEIARCAQLLNMCSGWFNYIEPSLSTPWRDKQCVQHAYALVRGSSG